MEKYTLEDAKNEIAKKYSKTFFDWNDMIMQLAGTCNSSNLIIIRLEEAAELYAKKKAIEFAEWIKSNRWEVVTHPIDSEMHLKWKWFKADDIEDERFLSEQQLYELFNQLTQTK